MDLNPDRDGSQFTFNFILQVWRPSHTVNQSGCHSLVNDFTITSTIVNNSQRVARVTPSPQEQLQFQPGDVLGFYVESHGSNNELDGDADNGVVLLNNGSHTSELVWFASIDVTQSQTSQSGSCPYPVGIDGTLNSSTRAAPVISISVMTTSCPLPSYLSLSSIISTSLPHPTRTTFTTSTRNIFMSSTKIAFTSSTITTKVPRLKSVTISSGLIAGIVVFICIVVCIISVTIIIFTVIIKRHSVEKQAVNTRMALSNCESALIIVYS